MTPGRQATNFFRVHERTLVAVSLAGLLLLGALAAVGVKAHGIRVAILDGIERGLDYWDDRWTRRLNYGERLVDAKEYARAIEYLAPLDRDFPARHVKHKRDMERERLLRALGRSYSETGKKRLALETYRRLVEFDPRNFESRHLLAQACLRFEETEMAEEQLAGVLKIHPTHMPSVGEYLKIHFNKANFAAVVAAYETYLNAFLMQQVTVGLGQSSAKADVPVDGRFRDVKLRLAHPPKSPEELVFQVGEFAIEISRVAIEAPLLVGRSGLPIAPLWPGQISWRVREMAPVGVGSYRALGPGAALRFDVPSQPQGVAAIHLRLRLFKPLAPDLWSMVEKSYKNLLRYDDLEAARGRSLIGISKGAGL